MKYQHKNTKPVGDRKLPIPLRYFSIGIGKTQASSICLRNRMSDVLTVCVRVLHASTIRRQYIRLQ